RAALVPAELRSIMESGRTWTDIEPALRPGMATLIFTNNIQVAFLAFAGGVLFGLGTVYVLVSNGLMLGSVMGAAQFYGVGPLLWSFISPHGYLELTCIVIAGAAGLMLGDALLRPGLLMRREALARAARRAVELVLGAAPVLVIAGFIEAFVSPSDLPIGIKLAIGLLAGCVLYTLLLSVGRNPRSKLL
ncbi:MAG: stage II sporulation protein M, partial [Chloroflexi bacterium]|nr:stage II sporulation protein M [Chloroflexota bacterium]